MQKNNWNQIRECGTYTMSWSGVVELSRRRYLWFSNPILCVIRSKSVAYLDRRYECLKSALWLNKSLNVVSTPFCLYEKNRWVEFNLFFFILFALNFFYTTGCCCLFNFGEGVYFLFTVTYALKLKSTTALFVWHSDFVYITSVTS